MKVILLKDLKGQGKAGELITVNDGYAKNFIIPNKIGVEASKQMLHEYEQKLLKIARLEAEAKERAMAMVAELKNCVLDVAVKCGEGKMYGSVTNQDIANALKLKGYEIDKKKIVMKEQIKQLGLYEIEIKVYPELSAKVSINVIKQKD